MSQNFDSYLDILSYRRSVFAQFPDLADGNPPLFLPYRHPFWKVYREQKEKLRQARIYVYKLGEDYFAEAKKMYDPKEKENRTLEEAQARWEDALTAHCDVAFIDQEVVEKVNKNGSRRYTLRCPSCGQTRTSALPHVLVEYLLKEEGLPLVTKCVGGAK